MTVNEIISLLAKDGETLAADIYLTPPYNGQKSDEETPDINNLERSQLLAEAEFCAIISVGWQIQTTDMIQEPEEQTASTWKAEQVAKNRRVEVTRKWRAVDIVEKEEKGSRIPDFIEEL